MDQRDPSKAHLFLEETQQAKIKESHKKRAEPRVREEERNRDYLSPNAALLQ